MSPQNAIRAFLHENLEPGILFRNSARRIPIGSHLFLDLEFQSLLVCLAFTESHSRQMWNRKNHGWNSHVTPAASKFMSSISGTRPAAWTTMSASNVRG